jgi:hypothetical protein
LFTSEGCSSCPPADELLGKMDAQTFPSVELVVLEEHVDYWDHDGWRDPYSSADFTERQKLYGERLHTDEVYTPQMIVDGKQQFNGSDSAKAGSALKAVSTDAKRDVRISAVAIDGGTVSAHLACPGGNAAGGTHVLSVFAVVALSHAETDVKSGENSHRHLTHTAVARTFTRVVKLKPGEALDRDVRLKLDAGSDPRSLDPKNLRLVVFLQDEGTMKVYGAAVKAVE